MKTEICYFHEPIRCATQAAWGVFALVNPDSDAPSATKILLSAWPTETEAEEQVGRVKREFDLTLVGMTKTKAQLYSKEQAFGAILQDLFLEVGPGPQITPKLDADGWGSGWETIANRLRDIIIGAEEAP